MNLPNPYNDRLPEPVPRADGTCVVCENPIPPNAGKYGDADAFDTRKCCQLYFGTSLAVDVDQSDTHDEGRSAINPVHLKGSHRWE